MPALRTFASILSDLMTERRVTAYQLCKDCGFSRATVSRFLKGQRQPSFECLVKIARALDVSLLEFDYVDIGD